MTDYTQTTDFSTKDSLASGDPEKIILGADIDLEFSAISTAIASKVDEPSSPNLNDVMTWNGSTWIAQAPPSDSMPVGAVIPYGGGGDTGVWLLCDGRALLTASYTALFGVIGYFYGGSGSTFHIPDLRGRTPRGSDDWGTARGDALLMTNTTFTSGSRTLVGSLAGADSTTALIAHAHTGSAWPVSGSATVNGQYSVSDVRTSPEFPSWVNGPAVGNVSEEISVTPSGMTASGVTTTAGAASFVELMDPFQLMCFLIKTS